MGICADVLVLEREPVSAQMVSIPPTNDIPLPLSARWRAPLSQTTVSYVSESSSLRGFAGVLIRVYPHRRGVEPEEVAVCYEETLKR